MKRRTNSSLASDLARLPSLNRVALTDQWRQLYATEPPARIGNGFLISAIAYRMQEQALGGVKPATQRYLVKVAAEAAGADGTVRNNVAAPIAAIKPGTRLLREWHGVTYEVVVLESGVQCNGVRYRSLSEVARHITGTKWSGPLFFGLKKRRAA